MVSLGNRRVMLNALLDITNPRRAQETLVERE